MAINNVASKLSPFQMAFKKTKVVAALTAGLMLGVEGYDTLMDKYKADYHELQAQLKKIRQKHPKDPNSRMGKFYPKVKMERLVNLKQNQLGKMNGFGASQLEEEIDVLKKKIAKKTMQKELHKKQAKKQAELKEVKSKIESIQGRHRALANKHLPNRLTQAQRERNIDLVKKMTQQPDNKKYASDYKKKFVWTQGMRNEEKKTLAALQKKKKFLKCEIAVLNFEIISAYMKE